MAEPIEILDTPEFWRYYQFGDAALPEDLLDCYLDKEYDQQHKQNLYNELTLDLPLYDEFELELTVGFNYWCINLAFRNLKKNSLHQCAWWDDERWHPFAIHWDELVALYQHWNSCPETIPIKPEQAFLLLAKFVGLGQQDRKLKKKYKKELTHIYESLEIFRPKEIENLTSATLVEPPDDDYDWSDDQRLGKVFGGEYPCYSIRNADHEGELNEDFPFADWIRLMKMIAP